MTEDILRRPDVDRVLLVDRCWHEVRDHTFGKRSSGGFIYTGIDGATVTGNVDAILATSHRPVPVDPPARAETGPSAHLLGMLWHSPQMIWEIRGQYQLRRDDFLNSDDGDLYQAMCEVAPERLSPADLSPELRLRLDALPKGSFPDGDYVRRIRIEKLEDDTANLRRRLAELHHHREGEGPLLAAELDRKQRQIEALRRSGGMEA